MWKVLNWSSDLSYIYSGDDPGKPCVFPFIWEDEIYETCTDFYEWRKVEKFFLSYQTLSFLITYRISAPLKLMKKEGLNMIMVGNTEPVVPTVLEKMTMPGWLMTPWKWPIIRNLKTRRTVWIILTSPTLSLYPAPVLQQRPGPVWWEFTALLTRPTRADLSGDTLFTLINCITLVTDGKYQYQYHDWKYQEQQVSGE